MTLLEGLPRPVDTSHPPGQVPRVSVGMPVYNADDFVREAIESHLAQHFGDFELIISDNASTDTTGDICRELAARDPRIRYVRAAQNHGAAWNFNHVLSLARGDYFKWSAADDVCAPGLLCACTAALDADPGAVLAQPGAAIIDEDGLVAYAFEDVVSLGPWPRAPKPRVAMLLQALFQSGLAAVAAVHGVARTAALRSLRPFGSYFGSDFALVTELATRGRFVQVPGELAFFRRHAASSSGYTRRPSARRMQQFFDPRGGSALRQELNLRRRYYEVARAIATAPLSRRDRAVLLALTARLLAGRAAWRLRFELGKAPPPASASAPKPPVHWSEAGSSGYHPSSS